MARKANSGSFVLKLLRDKVAVCWSSDLSMILKLTV